MLVAHRTGATQTCAILVVPLFPFEYAPVCGVEHVDLILGKWDGWWRDNPSVETVDSEEWKHHSLGASEICSSEANLRWDLECVDPKFRILLLGRF